MEWINRLELKWGRYAIPNLIHYITGINLLVFVLYKTTNLPVLDWLYLSPRLVLQGQLWRLVSFVFIPSIGGPLTDYLVMFLYMLFLLMLGRGLEHAWGSFKLNLFYFMGMAGTAAAAMILHALDRNPYEFSSFLLNSSLFFAFARFYPESIIYVMFVLPVKVKWMAWLSAAGLLLQFLSADNSYRACLIVAMANYLLFFWRDHFQEARLETMATDRRARFKKETLPDYEPLHRCVVCGRTDLSHSDLEFRVGKDGNDYCIEHLPK